jgi:hypothetical protein
MVIKSDFEKYNINDDDYIEFTADIISETV